MPDMRENPMQTRSDVVGVLLVVCVPAFPAFRYTVLLVAEVPTAVAMFHVFVV